MALQNGTNCFHRCVSVPRSLPAGVCLGGGYVQGVGGYVHGAGEYVHRVSGYVRGWVLTQP